MHLTAHELALVPSTVAIAAIVGGYLGVRSANTTAVSIARDERAARRRSDLDAQKRAAYCSYLVALSKLTDDQIELDIATRKTRPEKDELWFRAANSARLANDNLANLCLIASEPVRALANAAFNHALKASANDIAALAEEGEELADAIRNDLQAD
jgi:hypothetical protein